MSLQTAAQAKIAEAQTAAKSAEKGRKAAEAAKQSAEAARKAADTMAASLKKSLTTAEQVRAHCAACTIHSLTIAGPQPISSA